MLRFLLLLMRPEAKCALPRDLCPAVQNVRSGSVWATTADVSTTDAVSIQHVSKMGAVPAVFRGVPNTSPRNAVPERSERTPWGAATRVTVDCNGRRMCVRTRVGGAIGFREPPPKIGHFSFGIKMGYLGENVRAASPCTESRQSCSLLFSIELQRLIV